MNIVQALSPAAYAPSFALAVTPRAIFINAFPNAVVPLATFEGSAEIVDSGRLALEVAQPERAFDLRQCFCGHLSRTHRTAAQDCEHLAPVFLKLATAHPNGFDK